VGGDDDDGRTWQEGERPKASGEVHRLGRIVSVLPLEKRLPCVDENTCERTMLGFARQIFANLLRTHAVVADQQVAADGVLIDVPMETSDRKPHPHAVWVFRGANGVTTLLDAPPEEVAASSAS
jgi:hypothetical protein